MQLDSFVKHNLGRIVDDWEICTREILSAIKVTSSINDLREHSLRLVASIAIEMQRHHIGAEANVEANPSMPVGKAAEEAAAAYASSRHAAAFSTDQLIRELSLLRAIVSSLWRQAESIGEASETIVGLGHFNEALDRVLGLAVRDYTIRATTARDTFLAILGHDLRSPLQGIAAAGSVLASPVLPEAARTETANRIVRATRIMESLISDLLDFTRSRLGVGMPIERSECDVQGVCEEALEMARMSATERVFNTEYVGNLITKADRSRIRQLLSNLLNNAVEHGDGAAISLSARGRENAVVLTVSNSGKSILPLAAQTLFEPLVRLPITTSDHSRRRKDSLGLGLFIAREIVNAHGGTIAVDSSTDGITTFTIHLPRLPAGV
jgi:signal transduction histidine kinase